MGLDHGSQRIKPFLSLLWIGVGKLMSEAIDVHEALRVAVV